MEPLPWVFAVFHYFGEILPLVESLLSALEDEIYIMGWRPVTSSKMAANMAAILDYTKIKKLL